MDEVSEVVEMATESNPHANVIFIIILVLVATVFILENIKKFKEILGIKDRWDLHEESQGKQIADLKEQVNNIRIEVDELKSYSKEAKEKRMEFENSTTDTLREIREQMIQDRVDTLRTRILEFGSSCQVKQYTKENYDNILKIADDYHALLKKEGLSNSQTDMAMEYIRKQYAEYMVKGFPIYSDK